MAAARDDADRLLFDELGDVEFLSDLEARVLLKNIQGSQKKTNPYEPLFKFVEGAVVDMLGYLRRVIPHSEESWKSAVDAIDDAKDALSALRMPLHEDEEAAWRAARMRGLSATAVAAAAAAPASSTAGWTPDRLHDYEIAQLLNLLDSGSQVEEAEALIRSLGQRYTQDQLQQVVHVLTEKKRAIP